MSNLNEQQFGFHISRKKNRESIEKEGLRSSWSRGDNKVFTFNTKDHVEEHAIPDSDIYQVPVSSNAIPDEYVVRGKGKIFKNKAKSSEGPIKPDSIKRVGHITSDKKVHWTPE